ncbi:MAG: protein phosphatase 2C domain-containing protein [Planctomycetota bacterium]
MDEHTANWDPGLEHASLTDVGLRRANNQDSLAVVLAGSPEKWRQRGHLFIVADGMGAHAAGERASKLATDVVPLTYHKLIDHSLPDALAAAVVDANRQINARGQASDDFRGMGTTISALVLSPGGALAAHVGDSRAYRWRDDRLEQLTFDHSLVWELKAAQQDPEAEIPTFIPKNVITRSLGPNPDVQVDLEGPFPARVGDIFLLCSDGLSGPVSDEEIGTILGCLTPEQAARALVDLANLRGGPDNITVIVVRITGPEAVSGPAAKTARPRSRTARRPVSPLTWTLLGGFALGAVGLVVAGYEELALASLIGAVATGVAALVRRFGGDRDTCEFAGLPLGKGPYTARHCTADARFVDRLVELTHQLRDAAIQEAWVVDWNRFNAHYDRALAAALAADHTEAVREHCHAVSFMMSELRGQRGRQAPGFPGTSAWPEGAS